MKDLIKKSKAKMGTAKLFTPHTTAALIINQNANPDVLRDFDTILRNITPAKRYLNPEGNSDAHFKSALFGVSLEIPISNGELGLGPWQGIFFCEFDGPRTRNVVVQIFGITEKT